MSRILPILFNTEMVLAILDDRKTNTRRVIKKSHCKSLAKIEPREWIKDKEYLKEPWCSMTDTELIKSLYKPPYRRGDILYVRETWQCWRAHRYEATADIRFRAGGDSVQVQFANGNTDSINREDYDKFVEKWYSHHGEWHPSIHMPKEAARIWLKVTDVRVEQLQDIDTEDDRNYVAEGAMDRHSFIQIWDSTVKDRDKYGWYANPWVWVIEFERCEKPEPCILSGVEPAEDKRPCIGYGQSDDDDELCEMCKGCKDCSGNEEGE